MRVACSSSSWAPAIERRAWARKARRVFSISRPPARPARSAIVGEICDRVVVELRDRDGETRERLAPRLVQLLDNKCDARPLRVRRAGECGTKNAEVDVGIADGTEAPAEPAGRAGGA